MDIKTNFSFELYYAAQSTTPAAQRGEVMHALGPSLQALLAAGDSRATVTVSDSHKGSDNRIVELVTTLPEARIAEILKGFCEQQGMTVSAIE
ncbi:hypothetical protein [Polaromonas sp.]|uniref:hypothetical protein n=1 Tax=Polaromonas sp. TaxID=1869339 RepID=UPI003BA97404